MLLKELGRLYVRITYILVPNEGTSLPSFSSMIEISRGTSRDFLDISYRIFKEPVPRLLSSLIYSRDLIPLFILPVSTLFSYVSPFNLD